MEAGRISKKDWRTFVQSGIALIQQNKPRQALAKMLRAQRLARNERDVQYWLANAYRMTGETERAIKLFHKLLHSRPDDFDASFAMAFLLRDAGRPGEAAEALLMASEQAGITPHQLLQATGFLRDSNQQPVEKQSFSTGC